VTDVYVYRFVSRDAAPELSGRASRRATLETIKQIGEPIMESQMVVDDAELDSLGFFCNGNASDPRSAGAVANEINSLNLRAASRDVEALELGDGVAADAHKYMLRLESRELRKQAKRLRAQHEAAAGESHEQTGMPDFSLLSGSPTAG
jgi:hypothetical protein